MRFLFVNPNASKLPCFKIGIGLLSSILKKEGHNVDLFDTTFIKKGLEERSFLNKINDFKPDMIGYAILSSDYALAKKLNKVVKKLKIPSLAGGQHPTFATEKCLEHFDYVLRGECETSIIQFINSFPNVTRVNESFNELVNLNDLPFPDWNLFDKRHFTENGYIANHSKGVSLLCNIEKGRGCLFNCSYCSSPSLRKCYKNKGVWRREKTTDYLIREIKSFKKLFPELNAVHFVDDCFKIKDVNDLKDFAKRFKNEIGVEFSTSERPEFIDKEYMKYYKQAGGYLLYVGLESGDSAFRKRMLNRYMTNQVIINAFKIAKKAGIVVRATAMVGLPTQDDESYLLTYDLVGKLDLDSIQYTIFLPFIGTELYDFCLKNGYIDKNYVCSDGFHSGSPLKNVDGRKIVRYQKLLYHFQTEHTPFKRFLVKYGGKSEVCFFFIFFLYMLPRILYKNKRWFKTQELFRAFKRGGSYYLTKNS